MENSKLRKTVQLNCSKILEYTNEIYLGQQDEEVEEAAQNLYQINHTDFQVEKSKAAKIIYKQYLPTKKKADLNADNTMISYFGSIRIFGLTQQQPQSQQPTTFPQLSQAPDLNFQERIIKVKHIQLTKEGFYKDAIAKCLKQQIMFKTDQNFEIIKIVIPLVPAIPPSPQAARRSAPLCALAVSRLHASHF